MNTPTTRAAIQQRINAELHAMVRAIDTRATVGTMTGINRRLAALRAKREQLTRRAAQ